MVDLLSAKALGTAAIGVGAAFGMTQLYKKLKNPETNPNQFGSALYFPNDLGADAHPHYISLSFQAYQRRSIFQRAFMQDTGSIRLPLPDQMVNASQVTYDQHQNGVFTGAILENVIGGAENAKTSVEQFTGGAVGLAQGTAAGAVALGLGGSNSAAGLRDQAMQLAGVAQNPFLTILFKSPTFKRHSFSWTLWPNNAKEVETVRNIVNKFQYHQLPELSGYSAGTLMTYPDIVNLQFYPDDTYLYKFKPCVIESFIANFSPNGQPSFFNSVDAPTAVQIQINLLEIELWTKETVLNAQGLSQYNGKSTFVDPRTIQEQNKFSTPPEQYMQNDTNVSTLG